jgi:hypothetical protein
MEITTKPSITMSDGLLMDHSRNTIGMNLIVIFFTLLLANEMGHTFFKPSAWNAITMEWASIPRATLFHMCKVFVKN